MPWRCPVVDRDAPTVIEAVGIERVANGYQGDGRASRHQDSAAPVTRE
jgi:hypothetical protein